MKTKKDGSLEVSLYTPHEIDSLQWPAKYDGSLVKDHFLSMMKESAKSFVENGACELALLKIQDIVIPITINEKEYTNSYVTSIYAYLIYAEEEMERYCNKPLQALLRPLLRTLSFWFKKAMINRVVTVNNHLFSTNLYDPLTPDEIDAIHTFLVEKFPSHAIIFRSLNPRTTPLVLNQLQNISYQMITTRSVYFFDPNEDLPFKKRWNIKTDRKLLNREEIEIVQHHEFSDTDIPRIKKLYDYLYIDKYSSLNPQFSETFFKNVLKSNVFTLQGIKYQKKLVAVVGYFTENNIMATPIVGYDSTLPQSLGLYRMAIALAIQHAQETTTLFHFSAGVGHFKRSRGSKQEIETLAVYLKHLPLHRRLPWAFLKLVFNGLARPLMIKHKW